MRHCYATLTLTLACVLTMLPITVSAQQLTRADGSTDPRPYVEITQPAVPGTMTHSISQTVTAFNSVSCNNGAGHTDNSYIRKFHLPTFGHGSFAVTDVDLGIESSSSTDGSQPATLNLRSWDGATPFKFVNLPVYASTPIVIGDLGPTVINIPIAGGDVPGDNWLVVEFFTPNGQAVNELLWVGSNNLGETDPSYIAAADCAIPEPTTTAAAGFPGMHIVMTVNGEAGVLPVELIALTALVDGRDVVLDWTTETESENSGFEVQRKSGEAFEAVGFVTGAGTTIERHDYSFRIADLEPGSHTFRLKQMDFDGTFAYSPEVEALVEIPGAYVLDSFYPNPFNPQGSFGLTVGSTQYVNVELFDVLGKPIQNVFSGLVEDNDRKVITVDGSRLSSGTYFLSVAGETFVDGLSITLSK